MMAAQNQVRLPASDRAQGGFKIGARTALSARSWLRSKFARTRLSALQFPRFLNPPSDQGSGLIQESVGADISRNPHFAG